MYKYKTDKAANMHFYLDKALEQLEVGTPTHAALTQAKYQAIQDGLIIVVTQSK